MPASRDTHIYISEITIHKRQEALGNTERVIIAGNVWGVLLQCSTHDVFSAFSKHDWQTLRHGLSERRSTRPDEVDWVQCLCSSVSGTESGVRKAMKTLAFGKWHGWCGEAIRISCTQNISYLLIPECGTC